MRLLLKNDFQLNTFQYSNDNTMKNGENSSKIIASQGAQFDCLINNFNFIPFFFPVTNEKRILRFIEQSDFQYGVYLHFPFPLQPGNQIQRIKCPIRNVMES